MATGRDGTGASTNGRAGAASLELHLGRGVFATSRHLSGVVVFRLSKPTSIRSIVVSVSGRETPSGASLSRALRGTSSFFSRDVLLSGREQPRFASDRASQFWNAFLGRDTGRMLSPGEHTYPFSIPLPASLPPSYEGRAGKIEYTAAARVQFPTGRVMRVSRVAPVVAVPRTARAQPVALSYPTAGGTVHTSAVSVNLELPDRTIELGHGISGRFSIANPKGVEIGEIEVSLETVEWVRLTSDRELQRQCADSCEIRPDDPAAAEISADFKLGVPASFRPSVEGTAISVIWFLKLSLGTDPPLELKTPITVYASAPEQD